MDYDTLYQIVLDRIKALAKAALADSDKVGGKLKSSCETEAKSEQDARSHAIIKAQDRIKVLERMIGKLYEDIATGKITQSNFDSLIAKAQSEQEALEKQIAETQKVLDDTAIRESDARQWAEHIKEYANIRELDRETLNRLVRSIIVHEEIDDEKNRNITIEIHFNFKSLPEISGADDPVGTTGKTEIKKVAKSGI